jgi:hypothetical protein
MLFQAVMKYLSRLAYIKILVIRGKVYYQVWIYILSKEEKRELKKGNQIRPAGRSLIKPMRCAKLEEAQPPTTCTPSPIPLNKFPQADKQGSVQKVGETHAASYSMVKMMVGVILK